ncbi:hypothetical protein MTR67_042762, partial [Solanum verrucosum]
AETMAEKREIDGRGEEKSLMGEGPFFGKRELRFGDGRMYTNFTMNALANAIDLMNKMFKQYLDMYAIVFINDILIYYQSQDEQSIICLVTSQGSLVVG